MSEIANGVTTVFGMLSSVADFFTTPIGIVIIGVPVVGVFLALIARLIPRG